MISAALLWLLLPPGRRMPPSELLAYMVIASIEAGLEAYEFVAWLGG